MVCNMTRFKVKVKVTSPWKLEICPFSEAISSAIYNGNWQLTTHSCTRAKYLILFEPDIWFYLSFCVTWLWTWQKRQLRRVDSQSRTGLIFKLQSLTRWNTLRKYKSPRKRFCRQHLATLATPTILRLASFEFPDWARRNFRFFGQVNNARLQSPFYGVFWLLLPHPSTDRNETQTWSSLSL